MNTPLSATVSATVHSDDYYVEFEFDAVEYFRQASDEELLALAEIDYGGDYAADEIAQFYDATLCKPLFDYLDLRPRFPNGDTVGYEVHVDEDDAVAYMRKNRPHLLSRI